MSFSSIELTAPTVGVTIARASGSNLAVNGPICQGLFGINSDGAPYLDTGGPSAGEVAALGWDGSVASLFLDSRSDPDEHLVMLAAQLRSRIPVRLAALRLPDRSGRRGLRRRTVSLAGMGVGQSGRAAARSRTACRPPVVAAVAGVEVDGMRVLRAAARAR